MFSVRAGGKWLTGLRLVEDHALITRWPGGPFETTFTIDVQFGWRHASLTPGNLLEVFDGPLRVLSGRISEIDWESGQIAATGLCRDAESFPAMDLSLNTTSIPSVAAITAALEFGWPIGPDASVPSTPVVEGDVTDGINKVNTILDAAAEELGQRWAVDANGLLFFAADQTAPRWHLIPGVVEFGQVNENYRSDVLVRYVRDTDSSIVTERAEWPDGGATRDRYGFSAEMVDVRELGAITTARATAIGQGVLAKCAPQPGWTTPAEVAYGQVLTVGGEVADLTLITAGDVVRLHGVFDDVNYLGVHPYLDVVIGEVRTVDGARTAQISPVDAVPQDMAGIQEEVARALAA